MAQQERKVRQAMRQRGAGLRNINNPDFDFDLDAAAAGSREERRLMRQRGAGNREVNNIDFGFAFATPKNVPARRSRTRSKTPGTLNRTPLRETGENRQLPAVSAKSTRSTGKQNTPSGLPSTAFAQQSRRKRRRLSEVSDITQATSLDIPLASEHSNVDVQEPRISYQAPEGLGIIYEDDRRTSRFEVPSSPLLPMNSAQDEDGASKEDAPALSQPGRTTTRKRKRKSIGQQSLFKRKRVSGGSASQTPTPQPSQVSEANEAHSDHPNLETIPVPAASPETSLDQATLISPPTTQPLDSQHSPGSKPQKRRKKRKSIVLGKKKRKSDASTRSADTNSLQMPEFSQIEDSVQLMNADDASGMEFDKQDTRPQSPNDSVLPPRRRAREPSEHAPENNNVRDEEDADETYLPDEATPEPTPAPKRATKAKPKTKRIPRSVSPNSSNTMRRKKTGFPILTHRMTNAHTLPTIAEEPEPFQHPFDNDRDGHEPSSADELSAPPPPTITTRSAPNAVDVLAQVCRETIDTSIKQLKEDTSSHRARAEVTRQVSALQNLRSTLDTRLFDLSQSLDQRLHLEARLRKSRREKNELQARWLEVRKQRDLVALKMDGVRRRHWEGESVARRVWEVSRAAERVETLVARGNDSGDVGPASQADLLEFSLREVGKEVSLSEGGGILSVLRRFNGHLERAVSALG